ncbi:MAG: F420-dependent methylene-tetrahydromethanopterin reductase, partial [Rhodococcus sp.]|nr:F420-dependent methylene-tetrahydromethanopterin reductase [Rhodococcus sp. (in: high G+C Gram-positive bacteria)]
NINPYHLRDAIGDLVDKLVPALQERGVFRTEYTSTTLRGHLGLDGDDASERARAS